MSKAVAKKSPKTAVKSPSARAKSAPKNTAKAKSASRKSEVSEAEVSVDRRRASRREEAETVAVAPAAKLERREKVNRRRQIDPTTCERDYSLEEVEFMNALDDYKRKNGRMFPTCSEVLEVIRSLGYVKSTPLQAVTAADLEAVVEAEALAAVELSAELHGE